MYQTSLYFKTKEAPGSFRVLELFFKAWVDDSCNNEVQYKVERDIEKDWMPGMVHYHETFRVDFERQEDAVALKLKGIPDEFQKYLEMLN
jgi:hypothetical protein